MADVTLYIYDLSQGLARSMSLGLTGRQLDGIWHTSVVVYDLEVFYGQGISITRPGQSHHGQPLRKTPMGQTHIDEGTFMDYIDALRERYTASNYHLLGAHGGEGLYNCNSFTAEVVGFLTGSSIPQEVRDLPADFLSTPFGQMMRPQIDAMFRSTAPPVPSGVPAADMASALHNGSANGLLGQVASRATAPSASSLAGSLTVCTNQAAFDTLLRDNRAVVAMFTRDGCPPCRTIKPVFESLAADAKQGAFVVVDTVMGGSLAAAYNIRATPTFIFFLDGKAQHELKGADQGELKMQVGLLLHEAYPPHPHSRLELPKLRAISKQTVRYTAKPNFAGLTKKLSSLALPPDALAIFRDRVAKALSASNASADASDIAATWLNAHKAIFSLPPPDWFPALDLLRLALVDGRFRSSSLAPLVAATRPHLHSALESRNTALTALKLWTNACDAGVSGVDKEGQELAFAVNALLAEDKDVRTNAAGLAFMLARNASKTQVDEDWAAQMGSALVEGLKRETEAEVVHRLAAALGVLLLDSPHSNSLVSLLEALEAPALLDAKANALKSGDARELVRETAQLAVSR